VRRLIMMTLCACGSDAAQMSAPDLAFICKYDCPNCAPQRGACSAHDYCSFGFEMDCYCRCGQWYCTDDGTGLYGCSGLLQCYIQCGQADAGQSCYDDCDSRAWPCALDLLNAYGDCITANCYHALDADSGMPFCDPSAGDPTAVPACNDCYKRILASGGACRAAEVACTTDYDKP
jgi:hypothetical protein